MSVPSFASDGVLVNGTGAITINGTAYVVNNFNVTRAVVEATDFTGAGLPQRLKKTAGIDTFTAELQIATSATTRPKFGDTFTATSDANYGAEVFALDPVDFQSDNGPGNIRVMPIKGWKSITGTITTS